MSYFKKAVKPTKILDEPSQASIVYVLKFKNPFHEKYSDLTIQHKRKYFARKKVLRLLKIEPMSKKLILKQTSNTKPDGIKSDSYSFEEDFANRIRERKTKR